MRLCVPALLGYLRLVGAEETKLLATGGFQDEPAWGGIRTAAELGAAGLDLSDAVLPAVVDDAAPASRDDVAVPVATRTHRCRGARCRRDKVERE